MYTLDCTSFQKSACLTSIYQQRFLMMPFIFSGEVALDVSLIHHAIRSPLTFTIFSFLPMFYIWKIWKNLNSWYPISSQAIVSEANLTFCESHQIVRP